MLTKAETKVLTDSILSRCTPFSALVLVYNADSALTRFANNAIHQNVTERDTQLILQVFDGKRSGSATTNRTDRAGLDELVERAKSNARVGPEDPDFAGLAGPAGYGPVRAFDEVTAEYAPDERAVAVGVVCRAAMEKGLNASGAYTTEMTELAVANSEGLFAYTARTRADFQTTVMSGDSSGRAEGASWRVADLDPAALGQEAIRKAELGRGPQAIEPGPYTVILDPYAVSDLLGSLNLYGMSAQAVQEGRSWMNSRMGKQAFSPLVSIWDDGLDPSGYPAPFDFEGTPKQRVDIVKDGVVMGPVHDRYSAKKDGVESTGHAIPPNMRFFAGPLALNLFMAPGEASTVDLIAGTGRGLYITRFWYTRVVTFPDCVVTGMTRDGVFMIENGEITHPVKNLRFTQSYANALANVEAVGSEQRLLISDFGGFANRVPALKLAEWNFTGSTV
ncbi:MAG TPA: TldD/PmbA family protein [Anaerolineales bacterium]|nr:TldD/PmbA family protein [Anaerolineales bacterium]